MLLPFGKWSIPTFRALASLQQTCCRSSGGLAQHQETPALPSDTNYFHLQLILKSFESKYIQQASVAVRDLLLLNLAPKHKDVLPDVHRSVVPSNLIFTVGDAAIPQPIARYTVLRSPHVDKKSREQFEKRVHKRRISISTVSSSELYWFLQHLKLYEFLGVQIQVNVSSRQYLRPPSQVPSTSILSKHRTACSDWYSAAVLQPAAQTPAEMVQEAVNRLQSVVQSRSPIASSDAKIVAAAPRRADYQAILDACKAMVLSLDSSSLNNSKLLLSRFAAVSCGEGNATTLIHHLMKLGLWLSKIQHLTGEKDAVQATEFLKFAETACQTLLDAHLMQQLSVPVKHAAS